MGFRGWSDRALEFYEGLEADNSKSYWAAHKAVYDEYVLAPMRELCEELAGEFGEPKLFRPYRDVRFSADKSPYKTQVAATIGPMAYVALAANGLSAGSGIYSFSAEQLGRYREAVASDLSGPQLTGIVEKLQADGVNVVGTGTLKSAPRGYPADHPRIALLRHKGLFAWHNWPPEPWLETAEAKTRIQEVLRAASGLASWLTEHVTGNRAG
jgi:uncharacterized protein (TIGR02453 family)